MISGRQAKDINADDVALGVDPPAIRRAFIEKLFFELAKFPGVATRNDHYLALACAVRDRLLHRWVRSARTYLEGQHRTVIYLSAEYLLGPQLGNNLLNLGIERPRAKARMESLGLRPRRARRARGGARPRQRRPRAARRLLHGLARDARHPGDRPRHPLRVRHLRSGDPRRLAGRADRPLARLGNPWEIRRCEIEHAVGFGGSTETDRRRRPAARRVDARSASCKGVPYDTPVARLRDAERRTSSACGRRSRPRSSISRRSRSASTGARSTRRSAARTSRRCSTRTTPATAGKQLRLEQEYFFVSCALQDCIRLLLQQTTIDKFAEKFAIQLNDTHPALAVPELMRLLMDMHGLGWDEAWEHHVALVQLHEPHADAGGARDVAAPALRAACCRGTSRSSTRSTAASSTRCARGFPATKGASQRMSASSTSAARRPCAWRTSRRWRAAR